MFIKVDPNNSAAPNYFVIDEDASLANLLANTNYPDCSAGPGMTFFAAAKLKQSQTVTCNNLADPLKTDIYEV